eukprot:2859520-Pleurochrysis_carterae.AAC.1
MASSLQNLQRMTSWFTACLHAAPLYAVRLHAAHMCAVYTCMRHQHVHSRTRARCTSLCFTPLCRSMLTVPPHAFCAARLYVAHFYAARLYAARLYAARLYAARLYAARFSAARLCRMPVYASLSAYHCSPLCRTSVSSTSA